MTFIPRESDETIPGLPEVVDADTWRNERARPLDREKAHTAEADAIAAARRTPADGRDRR